MVSKGNPSITPPATNTRPRHSARVGHPTHPIISTASANHPAIAGRALPTNNGSIPPDTANHIAGNDIENSTTPNTPRNAPPVLALSLNSTFAPTAPHTGTTAAPGAACQPGFPARPKPAQLPSMPPSIPEPELIARAEDFASRFVAPSAAAWHEAAAPLPPEITHEYAALGLAALQVTPANGGHGASFHTKLRVAEAIAAHCFPTAFALNNLQGSVTRMEREGSPSQIARYLPRLCTAETICSPALSEPGAGSDFAAIATSATRTQSGHTLLGWTLNGEKAWVTNGVIGHQLILYAQTEPGAGAKGIASFIVDLDTTGITRLPPEHHIGGSTIGACTIRLENVHIAEDDMFAPPGQAFKRGLRGITAARTHVAAMICATVDASLRIAVAHGGTRHAFGKPLLAHQGFRWQLADVATALEATRQLVARAADIIEAGEDAQYEAALAKKHAAEMAGPAIAACMQAMGAEGLRTTHPFGRHMAAARIAAYVDGTTEMQTERIAASLPYRYGPRPAFGSHERPTAASTPSTKPSAASKVA